MSVTVGSLEEQWPLRVHRNAIEYEQKRMHRCGRKEKLIPEAYHKDLYDNFHNCKF